MNSNSFPPNKTQFLKKRVMHSSKWSSSGVSCRVQPAVSTHRCSDCGGVGERSLLSVEPVNQTKSYPADSPKLVGTLKLSAEISG